MRQEAGTTVLCWSTVLFSQSKLFLYTQSVLRALYQVRSPWSVVRSPCLNLTAFARLPSYQVCVRGSTSYSIPVSNISKSTVYATNGIHWDVQSPFYSKPCCIRLCRKWFSDISSSGKPFFTIPVPVERDTNTGFSRCSGTTVH